MGSDSIGRPYPRSLIHFNPRSPDGERLRLKSPSQHYAEFQSTLPGWGATFNVVLGVHSAHISIHAPRMGSDLFALSSCGLFHVFQSTLPGWGATGARGLGKTYGMNFNPRSPDGERRYRLRYVRHAPYFNPRSPDGERPLLLPSRRAISSFQSTLPGWGATDAAHAFPPSTGYFNPRSPDGERPYGYPPELIPKNFNPRSPDGERPNSCGHHYPSFLFQSTLPGWGATRCVALLR